MQKIFFINGFGGSPEDVGELQALLENAGYTFHYIDLPGH